MEKESQPLTVFVTNDGLYEFERIAFDWGMCLHWKPKWQISDKKVSITVPEMTTLMTSVYLFKTRQVYLVINLSVNNFY